MVGMRKNKRGWITILEATIAVLLVSGVLMIVYTRQGTEDSTALEDYVFSLQKQVLSDISYRTDLRNYVLERNQSELDAYVSQKIPSAYNYSLELCALDGSDGFCKPDSDVVAAIQGKDLFAEETIISSELDPNTPGESTYEPTKVRLYIWENR